MTRRGVIALLCAGFASHAFAQAPDAGTASDPTQISAQIDSAVDRLVQKALVDARGMLAEKNYAGALKTLENAHELDAKNVDATVALAELQVLLGHAEHAESLYRELIRLEPERGSAFVALGDLLAHDSNTPERLKEAAELYARARELLGQDAALLLRQARLAATRGLSEDAEQAYKTYLASAHADDALRLELGDFYRDAGKPEEATRFYREVTGGEHARVAAQRIFELEVDREARRYGLARRDTAADAQARALATKARVQREQGQAAQAETLLREALRLSPGLPSVHADLADVLQADHDSNAAELEYLRSISLDGAQPEVALRLAQLYLSSKPPRAVEAALLAERTLQLKPDWTDPQLLLAHAYREQGDLPRALLHAKRYLTQASEGPERDEALALQASLELLLGGGARSADEPAHAEKNLHDPLARVRAFIARGRTDAALAELQRLKGRALNTTALMLQAQLLNAAGRPQEAVSVLERALAQAPEQADTQEALAQVLLSLHRVAEARPHLLACERAGSVGCRYRLAQLDAGNAYDPVGLLHARERLKTLHADRKSRVSEPEIAALLAQVERQLVSLVVLALIVLALLGAALLAVQRFRWGGIDLAELLDRHPETGPDVQRVLSAIRHEVLKHNTLMFGGLIETLQSGAPVREASEHIVRAFFGSDGHGGAAPRMLAYVEQLESLARAHGERLNVSRRDPLLSALLSGFERVRSVQASLLAADSLSPAARQRLAHALRAIDDTLNHKSHAELRALLDRVRLLQVDAPLLHAIFDRIRHEPALAAEDCAPLAIDAKAVLPCAIAIPQRAFDDILANLFRNALQASLRHNAERPARIGLMIELETDPVTALEQVVVRVRDRAPAPLDRARLRDAYIEAGLGLTADLVTRHEGSLDVSDCEPDGYYKAVLLRLPGAGGEAP